MARPAVLQKCQVTVGTRMRPVRAYVAGAAQAAPAIARVSMLAQSHLCDARWLIYHSCYG